MNFRTIGALGLGFLASALSLAAAPNSGKISGIVVDPGGTPEMGASVLVSSEQLLSASQTELLTNDRGRFSTTSLAPGLYSVKVTLAGFLPAMQQHIQVSDERTTLLEVMLGSVFSSFEKLRRPPDQRVVSDDWTWVLRSSAATRSVLQWQGGQIVVFGEEIPEEAPPAEQARQGRLVLSSGSDHPGSIANLADSPATAFVYDLGIGREAKLLMAGQMSSEGGASAETLGGEWLPSGKIGVGPATTLVVRESRLGPGGPTFRGLRISHDDQIALSDRVTVRYGGEFLAVGLGKTSTALRPRAEVAVNLARGWRGSMIIATRPWESSSESQEGIESTALSALDDFPTILLRHTQPIIENDLHEEIGLEHSLSATSDISAALFHDGSTHTAVIGRGGPANAADFLRDYFSAAFAYDGGASSSSGIRVAYRERVASNLDATVVYAFAGALTPDGDSSDRTLRDELATRYRHSLATRASTSIPRLGTQLAVGYKWLSGPTVSEQDAFGEACYHLDPYLGVQIRQPLPNIFSGHMEIEAAAGNLLAQGYVPMMTVHGQVVLVPSYRYFRGGLSFQF